MINRIVLVGCVTRAPELNPAAGCCTFRLEVSHPEFSSGEPGADAEASPVEVEVLSRNRRQAETLRRCVEAKNNLMVTGHLAPAGELTRIALEGWQFLPDDLVHVDLREEALRSPPPAARAAA
tara:strand:+ start:547 stop:915 length:369 start_codon:yes stop_codon:yes gene_type:complete